MKDSSCYHLLLTLGVFLLIVINYPLESFAISAQPSDASKPDRVEDCNEAKKTYSNGLALADNSDEEAQFYLRAIELCEDFFEAHNKLGEIYKSQGKYDLAIREFTKARRKWHFVEPIINLGEIYRMQGRYDLAETEFVEAVRIRPDSHEAWNQLKYIRKRLGEYDAFREIPQGEPTPTAIFTRVPGMTLPKGTWEIDLSYNYMTEKATLRREQIITEPIFFPRTQQRTRKVQLWILGLNYGLTNNFTIGLRPRFTHRTSKGQGATPSTSGLGDTNLLMKYHLWGRRRTHISLFHLLGIPTGDENASTEATVLIGTPGSQGRTELTRTFLIPLGSGAFSFTPGIAITMEKEPFTIHANVSYLFSDSTIVPDDFRCDLSLVLPRFNNFESEIGINYIKTKTLTGERLFRGFVFTEPGSDDLFFSSGIQIYLPYGYKTELGFQFPLIKPEFGSWLGDTILHIGLSKNFF